MYITLSVEATVDGINQTVTDLCATIENATSFTFGNTTVNIGGYMTIDGQAYYGTYCGPVSLHDLSD